MFFLKMLEFQNKTSDDFNLSITEDQVARLIAKSTFYPLYFQESDEHLNDKYLY
jgi:hypothetical protein